MGKLVVSLDGVVIKEVQITKDKTTLGRRPYNDIVIDNLAVSGEHAVLQMVGADVFIEDLNSTNGTYINGKAVKKQLLQPQRHGRDRQVQDQVPRRGRHRLREDHDHEARRRAGSAAAGLLADVGFGASGFGSLGGSTAPASIKVLNGAAAGREVMLTKVVTTVGKPGVQVASITKRPGGYVLAHVEGALRPTVNGSPVIGETVHAEERRRDRAGRHADAVRPGLTRPRRRLPRAPPAHDPRRMSLRSGSLRSRPCWASRWSLTLLHASGADAAAACCSSSTWPSTTRACARTMPAHAATRAS